MYSGTSLNQDMLGICTKGVLHDFVVLFGTAKCVLFIELSSFHDVLNKVFCIVV